MMVKCIHIQTHKTDLQIEKDTQHRIIIDLSRRKRQIGTKKHSVGVRVKEKDRSLKRGKYGERREIGKQMKIIGRK